MLKILRQNMSSKLRHIPDYEAVVTLTPRHNGVRRQIIHHVIRFAQKRRWRISYLINSFHFFCSGRRRSDGGKIFSPGLRRQRYEESEVYLY